MKIKTMTVDLPLRPKDATQYTPYERIAITVDIEDGESTDTVYTNLQLEIQRLYHTKHVLEDGYLQLEHDFDQAVVKQAITETIEDINTKGREQPKKDYTPIPNDDLPFVLTIFALLSPLMLML